MRSIEVVVREIAEAIKQGKAGRGPVEGGEEGEGGAPSQSQTPSRRRSSRFRSDRSATATEASSPMDESAEAGEIVSTGISSEPQVAE